MEMSSVSSDVVLALRSKTAGLSILLFYDLWVRVFARLLVKDPSTCRYWWGKKEDKAK